MSSYQFVIYGIITCTCGNHDSASALNPSSAFRMDPKTLNSGKDHITTSLQKNKPISDTVWQKNYVFNQITLTIYGLLKSHSVANLTPLITPEVPIKTFTTQQGASDDM